MRVRTLFSLVAIAAMLISMVIFPIGSKGSEPEDTVSLDVSFAGGTGTISDPYQVSNVTQLQNISSDLDSHYVLINNIPASSTSLWDSGAGFQPLGTLGSEFNGTFDGKNHTISGLIISRGGADGVGLFGYTGIGSSISNMNITGNITGRASVGALVGSSLSTVTNCHTNCRVVGNNNAIGGLVGFNEGSIRFCSAGSYTTGNWYLGGLVGQNNGGLIGYSFSYGTVQAGNGNNIGGLVGRNIGYIMNCNSSCAVIGMVRNNVGGVVGWNNGPIDACNNTGDVSGHELVGGIVGSTLDRVHLSFSIGDITASGSKVGGIAGQSGDAFDTPAIISYCFNQGDISGGSHTGGIAGSNHRPIRDCYNNADVFGSDRTGGIAGYSSNEVINSSNRGYIWGYNAVGGIIGSMYTNAAITRCFSIGITRGNFFVGGLAGNMTSSACMIQQSVNFGDVYGANHHAGGIVGWNYHEQATVKNCYSHGNVSASNIIGGVAGTNSGKIENCFSTGKISGSFTLGGLVGWNMGSVTNSYWDKNSSNTILSDGGTGHNTTVMISSSTYSGWDLTSIWAMIDGRSYPYLRWLPEGDPSITSEDMRYALEETLYSNEYEAIDDPISERPMLWFLEEGPDWLGMDIYSGVLSGTPGNLNVNTTWVNVSVFDGTGGFNWSRFRLKVNNTNDPVMILSEPKINATEEVNYTYVIDVQDDDLLNPSGEVLTFYMEEGPDGMHIGRDNGTLWWIPTNEQALKTYNVTINVTDGEIFDTQKWNITVSNVNDPVIIHSEPVLIAIEDSFYDYFLNVTDDDLIHPGKRLFYSLDEAPSGLSISHQMPVGRAHITWFPENSDVGRYHKVILNITDGEMYVLQEYDLWVENDNDRPMINTSEIDDAVEEVPFSFQIEAWDDDLMIPQGEELSFTLDQYPDGMTINSTKGNISWTPTNEQAAQENLVIVNVSDGDLFTKRLYTIFVNNTNDAPWINSTPVLNAVERVHYSYLVESLDDDLLNPSGEELSFTLEVFPDGMKMGFPPNLIVWVPELEQSGKDHLVVINISDGEEFVLQSYTIYVQRVTPDFFNISLGQVLFDDDSIAEGLNVTLRSDPTMEKISIINESGYFSFIDIYPGNYTVVIQGPTGNHTFNLKISVYGILRYDLPKIALPLVVDDDDITDDDIVDDDSTDGDDDPKDNSYIFVIITVAAVILLLIAGILMYMCYGRGAPHSEE